MQKRYIYFVATETGGTTMLRGPTCTTCIKTVYLFCSSCTGGTAKLRRPTSTNCPKMLYLFVAAARDGPPGYEGAHLQSALKHKKTVGKIIFIDIPPSIKLVIKGAHRGSPNKASMLLKVDSENSM